MHIIYFAYEFPPKIFGGLGTYADYISKELVRQGQKITIITNNYQNQLKEYEQKEGIEIFRPKAVNISASLPLFVREELAGWGDWLNYFGEILDYNYLGANLIYHKTSDGEKYDLVVSHDWLGIIGGLILQKEVNLPLIFHFHSTEIGRQSGGGSETIKRMEKLGAEKADKIITVSSAMKEELINFGLSKEKISVCWNGVDAEKYNPEKIELKAVAGIRKNYGIKENEFLLLFVGRLTEVKGILKLVEALPIVLKKFPKAKLLILGVGELEGNLKNLAKKLKLKEKVVFKTDFVSEELRILHYAACDLACFPSFYEPFGIVSLEAMAMKKPVVVGAEGTSGLKEQIITSGENMCGVHINPHDPNSIAWGINLLLEIDRQKLGENARKRVLQEFTWQKVAEKTLKIYQNVIS